MSFKDFIMNPAEFVDYSLRYAFPVMYAILAVGDILKENYSQAVFCVFAIIVLKILVKKRDERQIRFQ